jgi:Replication-relaxation
LGVRFGRGGTCTGWVAADGSSGGGLPSSYEAVHRGDALLLLRDRRPPPVELAADLAPQPRDLEILRALWRHRFLLTSQMAREWWSSRSLYAAQKRLLRLTAAGWVTRFRPRLARGKHEWIYQLAHRGFKLAKTFHDEHGPYIPHQARWRERQVRDYRVVEHDLQVNAWVMAYRQLAGELVVDWLGPDEARLELPTRYEERRFRPVRLADVKRALPGYEQAGGLRLERLAPVVPDASLRFWFEESEREFELLVELDRTRRPVKNLDKLRRYDALITGWWLLHDRLQLMDEPPLVVFVCTDEQQALALLDAAEHEVTGRLANPGDSPARWRYPGRQRMLFAAERDVHEGDGRAWMLEPQPADNAGDSRAREVDLPAI